MSKILLGRKKRYEIEVKMNLCLDRACQWQEMYSHFAHNKDSDFLGIVFATNAEDGINVYLEGLKSQRGRRCLSCSRYLIPSDSDHSFCDDCWDDIMYHPFVKDSDDDNCAFCGEPAIHKDHMKSSNAR